VRRITRKGWKIKMVNTLIWLIIFFIFSTYSSRGTLVPKPDGSGKEESLPPK